MVIKETLGPSDYCLSLQERRAIIQILLNKMDPQQRKQWFDANKELAIKYFKKAMKKKQVDLSEVIKFVPMTYTSEWSPFQKKKHKICVDAKYKSLPGSVLNFYAEFCPVVEYKIRSVLLEAEMGQIDNQCNSKKPGDNFKKKKDVVLEVTKLVTGEIEPKENFIPCYCCGLPIIQRGGNLKRNPFGSQCDHMYPVTELGIYALLRHVSILTYIEEYFGDEMVERDIFIRNWYKPIHGGDVDFQNKRGSLKNDDPVELFPEGGGPQMGELMKWMHPACNEDKSNNPWYAIKWHIMKGGRMVPTINPNYKSTKTAMIDGKNIRKTLTNLITGKGRFEHFKAALRIVKTKGTLSGP